jgi:hypothetical protein
MEDFGTIQTMAQIRAEHMPASSAGEDKSAENYLEFLNSKGVALNPKLFPSIFYLKNGLPYTGMAVKEIVNEGEVLIRVPEEVVLSSAKAFEEPALTEIFRTESFFKFDKELDEDRILIVYSLFVRSQKDETHPWYQMIDRLPKECDIACFWSE